MASLLGCHLYLLYCVPEQHILVYKGCPYQTIITFCNLRASELILEQISVHLLAVLHFNFLFGSL